MTPAESSRDGLLKFAAIFGLLVFAAYPEVALGISAFFFRDFGYFGYPLASFVEQSLRRGELPLWNPLSNCGVPFLAQWNTMVLYPGTWLAALPGMERGLGWFCLGHQWLAGVGMYVLARRWSGSEWGAWIAGIAYGMGGLMQNSLMWPNNIAAFGLMPWVVWAGEQGWREGGRSLVLWILLGGVQMLTGAPEVILITWVITGTICLLDLGGSALVHRIGRLVTAVAGVSGLAACQLLPFLELLKYSQRDEGFARTAWSMPGTGWANLIVPLFHCFPANQGVFFQYDQWWTSSYYLGAGVLVLAILACWRVRLLRVWVLGLLGLTGLILALGDEGHLYDWIRSVFPQLGFLRYPVKFVVFATFAIPLLAAFGAAVVERESGVGTGWRSARRWTCIWMLLAATTAVLVWFAWKHPMPFDDTTAMMKGAAARLVLLGALFTAILALDSSATPRRRWFWQLGGAMVLWLDFMTHTPRQNPTVSPRVYEAGLLKLSPTQPVHGVARAMISPAADAKFRVTSTEQGLHQYVGNRLGLFSNCNMLDSIPKVNGFFSLFLRESERVRAYLYDPSNPAAEPLLDFLGVAYVTKPDALFDWVHRPSFMPLVTGGQEPMTLDEESAFKKITSKEWNPRQELLLPSGTEITSHRGTAMPAQIEALVAGIQSLQFTVTTESPCWVVVAQSWHPAWSATIGGAPAVIHRANHLAQAIQVPVGRHAVTFRYRDAKFIAGCWISGMTLLILGAFAEIQRRRILSAPGSESPTQAAG